MSPSIQPAPRRILSALKVLIVDDSPHMQAILKRVLTDMNIRDMVVAKDIESGLTQLQRIRPDFAFVDWAAKPEGGSSFVRAVRALDDIELTRTPLIMMAAQANMMRVKDARDAGINAFLAKPASVQAIMSRVLWVLSDARPFIQSERYTGPDRRTRALEHDGDERRRVELAPPPPKARAARHATR
jgi:two-component system, chemotaxis family, chemotaxis protein CheY